VTFTKSPKSSNFYGFPSINNSGTVAFGLTNGINFSAITPERRPAYAIATSTSSAAPSV